MPVFNANLHFELHYVYITLYYNAADAVGCTQDDRRAEI